MKPRSNNSKYFSMLQCTTLLFFSSAAVFAADDDIPALSGVWQWGSCYDGSGFGCMILEQDDARLTERAKAYRDAIDEAAQPKYDCAPISIPHLWTDPYSHQIEQLDDRVIFTYGKDDVVRTVWLEGHEHAEPGTNEFTYFGHSHGRYENGELIVVTNKFTFDPQGLNADFKLASSTQKQVSERYWLENDKLVIEISTIDTFFLKEPWVYKVRGQRDPNELALPWACDLEASRGILKLMPSNYPNDPPIERITY
ncbi:hypothetical protein [Sulfuriflexus sp.]|uniref:hypothetical protein n=1 Tax=Sulfuriflexus sp. TaxID=2015443 RepID=UPI0028CFA86F|nr:hypothetical protein [Sulfuriflexus sp.]MDT8405530.1 hypothetical protein [Sulfuriflexus sp.]